jgi:hypothetical protein
VEVREHVERSAGMGVFFVGWGALVAGFGAAGFALSSGGDSDAVRNKIIFGAGTAVGLAGLAYGVYALVAGDSDTRIFPRQ